MSLALLSIFTACGNDADDTLEFVANPLSNTSWQAIEPNGQARLCGEELHFTKDVFTQIIKVKQGNMCTDSLQQVYSYHTVGNKLFLRSASNLPEQEWFFTKEKNKLTIKTELATKNFIQNK